MWPDKALAPCTQKYIFWCMGKFAILLQTYKNIPFIKYFWPVPAKDFRKY